MDNALLASLLTCLNQVFITTIKKEIVFQVNYQRKYKVRLILIKMNILRKSLINKMMIKVRLKLEGKPLNNTQHSIRNSQKVRMRIHQWMDKASKFLLHFFIFPQYRTQPVCVIINRSRITMYALNNKKQSILLLIIV